MATKPRAFIDANIIANWLLLDGAVRELEPKGEKALRELREKTEKKFPSYLLLEELRKVGVRSPIKFGTSTFAIAETNHAILEEYISKRLYDRGVPFRYWEGSRKQERLSEWDEQELLEQVSRFLMIFSLSKHQILSWYDKPDFLEVEVEIILYRVSTTDGFLVSQAVEAGCKYYVTEDKDLRDRLARHRRIKPISAQAMLDELKRRPMPR